MKLSELIHGRINKTDELPVTAGISWHIRWFDGIQRVEFDLMSKIPISSNPHGLQLVEAEISIALVVKRNLLTFVMITPNPGSVALPNWRKDGTFVSPSTEHLIRNGESSLEDALRPVLMSLWLVKAETLLAEAVNRNALAWLNSKEAFVSADATPLVHSGSHHHITIHREQPNAATSDQPRTYHLIRIARE